MKGDPGQDGVDGPVGERVSIKKGYNSFIYTGDAHVSVWNNQIDDGDCDTQTV